MGNYQEMPSLLASSSVQDFLVVILVAVIACSTAIPERFHPLTLLHLLALRLAEKVHPDTHRSVFQQRLSGVLAPIVLIVPFLICIALAFQIVEFPIIFEALVLILCVRYKPIMAINRKLQRQLELGKKSLARHTIQTLVLRETGTLSELGLVKAGIETTLLRIIVEFIAPLFWFLIGGWWLTLFYRLTYELHQAWNAKTTQYQHFGKPVASLIYVMTWLPFQVSSLALFVIKGGKQNWRLLWKSQCPRWRYLGVIGNLLNAQLGGPCIYFGQKYRFSKVGSHRAPQIAHLKASRQWVIMLVLAWLILSIVLSSLLFLIGRN